MSNYCNKFILKGGWFLSSILGIDNRTTIDIEKQALNAIDKWQINVK